MIGIFHVDVKWITWFDLIHATRLAQLLILLADLFLNKRFAKTHIFLIRIDTTGNLKFGIGSNPDIYIRQRYALELLAEFFWIVTFNDVRSYQMQSAISRSRFTELCI